MLTALRPSIIKKGERKEGKRLRCLSTPYRSSYRRCLICTTEDFIGSLEPA